MQIGRPQETCQVIHVAAEDTSVVLVLSTTNVLGIKITSRASMVANASATRFRPGNTNVVFDYARSCWNRQLGVAQRRCRWRQYMLLTTFWPARRAGRGWIPSVCPRAGGRAMQQAISSLAFLQALCQTSFCRSARLSRISSETIHHKQAKEASACGLLLVPHLHPVSTLVFVPHD